MSPFTLLSELPPLTVSPVKRATVKATFQVTIPTPLPAA